MFNLFGCDGKDAKHLNHNLHDRIRQSRGRWDLDIGLQSSKDVLYALEEVNECSSTSTDTLSGLRYQDVTIARKEIMDMLTERRTPMPVNITPTGGYASKSISDYRSRADLLTLLETY